MTWTVTKEEGDTPTIKSGSAGYTGDGRPLSSKLHIRGIIDLGSEQAELCDLIASLQKHLVEKPA